MGVQHWVALHTSAVMSIGTLQRNATPLPTGCRHQTACRVRDVEQISQLSINPGTQHGISAAARSHVCMPLAPETPTSSLQGLGMVLSEGGAPLSAGQKQLAALARALLKRSKVRSQRQNLDSRHAADACRPLGAV
jgi:hypothetical protein